MERDTYDLDDHLMDELGGAMDGYEAGQVKPHQGTVIEISISPAGKPTEEMPEPEEEKSREGMLPTPEELEEMIKAANA